MSDFDFDELDKAVNGALDTSNTSSQEPESVKSTEEPQPQRSVERESVTPASRRAASGRFMDMVHPSSDMRSSSPVAARPVTPALAPTPTPTPTSRLPEPPKFTQPENPVPAPTLGAKRPEPAAKADWSSPLESPFLPDAKVEKRPLGGVEPEASSPLLSTLLDEPKEELLEAPDEPRLEATTLPDPIDFSAQYDSNEPETIEQPEVSDPVVAVENEEVAPEVAPETKSESAPEPAAEVSNTPISITQQYKEQPRSEQESGPIYDTEAYHQPIAHAGKKRSGWWVVLWIFLLIVLGAGAGAVVYLYVLPLL